MQVIQVPKSMKNAGQRNPNCYKNADFITLTVGGNDVMKVIRDNAAHLSKLKEKDFEQPARNYQNELKKSLRLFG